MKSEFQCKTYQMYCQAISLDQTFKQNGYKP